MNARERIMAILVGVVLGLLAVRAAVSAYTSALKAAGDRVERARKEIARIKLEKEEVRLAMESWVAAGLQSFSMQENEARTLLRDELHRLAAQTALEDVVVGLLPSRPLGKSGTRVVSGKIQAAGSLENLLQFLFQLQNQPYAVRVRKLELRIPSTGREVPKDRLTLSAEVETLVLPPTTLVKAVNTVNLAEEPRPTVRRTALADFADYKPILDRKMFQDWEPPIPPPPKVAGPNPPPDAVNVALNTVLRWAPSPHATGYRVLFGQDPAALEEHDAPAMAWKPPVLEKSTRYYWRVDAFNDQGRTEGDLWSFTTAAGESPPPPPPPVVKGPPPDAHMVLSRVLSSPLSQQAVLDNPANRMETRRVEVGEELYGGTLVFVHPTGVVSEADGQRRFHPLGQPLQNARPLSQTEQPEVYDLVTKLAERAAGIN